MSIVCGRIGVVFHSLFSSHKRFLPACRQAGVLKLITTGFYKEGDYLFGKSAENVLPADFDNQELFEDVRDVWLS